MFPGAKAVSCRPIVEMLLNVVPNLLQGCMTGQHVECMIKVGLKDQCLERYAT